MEIDYNELQDVLSGLSAEITNLTNLKAKVQALLDDSDLTAQVDISTIRYIGVLDDIFDRGGIVTAKELSDIAKSWGRDPRGTAGYYTGDNPSLLGIADSKRALTDKASDSVKEFRKQYGEHWKDHLDMNFVGNMNTSGDACILIEIEK